MLSTLLSRQRFVTVDGGLSTALEDLGCHVGGALWTAQLLLDAPERVVAAHRSFVDVGADVVISASYQASEDGFVRAGATPAQARAALANTTALARQSGAPIVAASVGPFGAVLADGSEYRGVYDASWADVAAFHRARLSVLIESGPDLFAVETMPTVAETDIVLSELELLGAPPAWVAATCADGERLWGGDTIEALARRASGYPNLVACGVNCTAPRNVGELLGRAAGELPAGLPLVVYPNHGRSYDGTAQAWIGEPPVALGDFVTAWVEAGARLIGGCCGHGAASIAELAALAAQLT
jgi:homocysteine S-methyltransferase